MNINEEKEEPQIEKESIDIILLIMNCNKYRNKALFQKQTWLKNIPSYIKYYHVLGDPDLNTDFVFDYTENILYVCCKDDYCSLPKKVIRSFNAVNNTFDFKYIFKTDDDQMLSNIDFISNLKNILHERDNSIHYGGNIITIKMAQLSMYNRIHIELPDNILLRPTKYSSGRFYFLSNRATKHLIKMKENIDKEYIEDYAIGYYLDQKLKEYMLFLSTDTYFRDIDNLNDWKNFNKKG
jgi:hypothetical protein